MKIEKAQASDEDAIRALYAEGENYLRDAPEIFREGTADKVLAHVKDGHVLVALDDASRVVGFVCIDVKGDMQLGLYVIVAQDVRGYGIGKALIEKGHELAKKEGARVSICQIWPQSGVQRFYENSGYKEIGRVLMAEL